MSRNACRALLYRWLSSRAVALHHKDLPESQVLASLTWKRANPSLQKGVWTMTEDSKDVLPPRDKRFTSLFATELRVPRLASYARHVRSIL